jgi:serine/threonine protein kinase
MPPHLFAYRIKSRSTETVPLIVGMHYHVVKCIGEGSFGVIYEGRSDLNGRKVAIKFVALSLT